MIGAILTQYVFRMGILLGYIRACIIHESRIIQSSILFYLYSSQPRQMFGWGVIFSFGVILLRRWFGRAANSPPRDYRPPALGTQFPGESRAVRPRYSVSLDSLL